MQFGLVSVMMPAFNAEQYIGQAVQSVIDQEYPQWELIIVNDGSTDGTPDIVANFKDPRIKLIHQANGGESRARNTALKHMSGEFVAFLDADDLYLPQHLAVMVDQLTSSPGWDGVYSDGYHVDQDGNILQTLSSRRSGPYVGRVYEELVRVPNVFGPPLCVVLRSSNIARDNLSFDEDIIIGPDWDFFIQYADLAQFGYIDQPTCLYRVHLDNITVRTGLDRRALDFARCRMKAIKMPSFRECSLLTQTWVFYDLLINNLRGLPGKQTEILEWPEFGCLPERQQANLTRLMASRAVIDGYDRRYVDKWLRRSQDLDPNSWRSKLVATTYRLSPTLCRQILRLRQRRRLDRSKIPPFADLRLANSVQG